MAHKNHAPKIDEQTKAGLHELSQMHEKLILKAWADPAFKKELIENPVKAVEKALGIKVPGFLKLKVIEETPDTRYITLPYRAQEGDRQLGDDELDRVAGGASATKTCGGGGSGLHVC